MRTKFFCTNFLNTARGPGHPGKIPGTSRIPLFETQGRQSFEGGHEVFGHHPFAWKTPTPPGGLRTQKLNLCAHFSRLSYRSLSRPSGPKCPGSVPENGGPRDCPVGCLWGPLGPGFRQKVSQDCSRSVQDTFLTLRGRMCVICVTPEL